MWLWEPHLTFLRVSAPPRCYRDKTRTISQQQDEDEIAKSCKSLAQYWRSVQFCRPWSSSSRCHPKIKYIILLLYPQYDLSASLFTCTNKESKDQNKIKMWEPKNLRKWLLSASFSPKRVGSAQPRRFAKSSCAGHLAFSFCTYKSPMRQGYHILCTAGVGHSPEKCPDPPERNLFLRYEVLPCSEVILYCTPDPTLWSRLA